MRRYITARTLPGELGGPVTAEGTVNSPGGIHKDMDFVVAWIETDVYDDERTGRRVYYRLNLETLGAAERSGLAVARVAQNKTLDDPFG
jgi:hypothetical protein